MVLFLKFSSPVEEPRSVSVDKVCMNIKPMLTSADSTFIHSTELILVAAHTSSY